MINFFDKLYVGIKDNQAEGELPLGFATPYEDNAAFRKRKETVDTWANVYRYGKDRKPNVEGKIIDNVPLCGFNIAKSVSRWSTSNKLFRINDPRGFQLEISALNLFQLLDNTVCAKGTFNDELIWGRTGADNILWPIDSDEYRNHLTPNKYVHEVGDTILYDGAETHVYVGKFYAHIVSENYHKEGDHYSSWSRSRPSKPYREWVTHDDHGIDSKPFHVYKFLHRNKDRAHKNDFHFRRSPFKVGTYTKADIQFEIKMREWLEFRSDTKHSWISAAKLYLKKTDVVKLTPAEVEKILIGRDAEICVNTKQ